MADNKAQAEALNEQGKEEFKNKKYTASIETFTKAVELVADDERFYANRSAAHAKLANWQESADDAKKCVELKPEWVKGYVRYAQALHMLKQYNEAVQVCLSGLAKDATNQALVKQMGQSQAASGVKSSEGDDGVIDEDDAKEAEKDTNTDLVIGIDLGTTYSCVAVWRGDAVEMIPNSRGEMTTPSYVAWTAQGQRLVGHGAKSQQARNPENTVYDVKRFIGQSFDDEGVQQDVSHMPYTVKADEKGNPVIEVSTDGSNKKTQFTAPEISAMVLAYLKQQAENYLGQPVSRAVITVPAYFNDAQRQATQLAGRIAGLEVMRIINEPTAAALSYGLDLKKDSDKRHNVLIFDLGGGTFDVSVLSIENGLFEVKATGGDTRLGGEDFDQRTVELLLAEAKKQGIDANGDKAAVKRLKVEAEKAKRLLSQAQSAPIVVEKLTKNGKKSQNFKYTLTRDQFERVNQGLFNRCLDVVKHVLKDSGLNPKNIHDVVLVGGSTRVPKIQSMLVDYFGFDLCKVLNPDEAVAFGAAVQAAILNGQRNEATKSILLRDVTPLSLGIETTGGVMSVLVPRNTPIPCVKTGIYTTEENYQTEIEIPVYEGERMKTANNHFLGQFSISDIEKAKRGEPKVLVQFEIDSNGVLTVSAKDQKTGSAAQTRIESRSQLSDNEVQRMVQEAAMFRKNDEANLQRTESQLALETAVQQAQEALNSLANAKLSARLESALRTAEAVLSEADENTKASKFISARKTIELILERANQF